MRWREELREFLLEHFPVTFAFSVLWVVVLLAFYLFGG
jgi:hypothetical protein